MMEAGTVGVPAFMMLDIFYCNALYKEDFRTNILFSIEKSFIE